MAGECGAEVGLATTRRYDRNHRATLEDHAGLSVVVQAHAASDQPTRHRERLLARSERAVVHPRMPLVHARPGAAARAGSKSSPRLHAKHSHVTAPRQEPCPGSAGACYALASGEVAERATASGAGRGGRRYRFGTRLCQLGHTMRQHGCPVVLGRVSRPREHRRCRRGRGGGRQPGRRHPRGGRLSRT